MIYAPPPPATVYAAARKPAAYPTAPYLPSVYRATEALGWPHAPTGGEALEVFGLVVRRTHTERRGYVDCRYRADTGPRCGPEDDWQEPFRTSGSGAS